MKRWLMKGAILAFVPALAGLMSLGSLWGQARGIGTLTPNVTQVLSATNMDGTPLEDLAGWTVFAHYNNLEGATEVYTFACPPNWAGQTAQFQVALPHSGKLYLTTRVYDSVGHWSDDSDPSETIRVKLTRPSKPVKPVLE